MKNLQNILWPLLFSLLATASYAEMYIWVDQNGVKHYSNVAPPHDISNVNKSGEILTDPREWEFQKRKAALEDAQQELIKQNNEKVQREKDALAKQKALEDKRKKTADNYVMKANEILGKKSCGAKEQSALLTSIGQSIMKCTAGDLDRAMIYFRQAEEKAKEAEKASYYDNHTMQYYCSSKIVEDAIKAAKVLKKAGDNYLQCPQAMIEKADLEDQLEEMKKEIERIDMKASFPR